MDYIEVKFTIDPFTEERAEIVEAMVAEMDFESFVCESPYLKAYIKKDNFGAQEKQNLKYILSFFDNNQDFKIFWELSLVPEQNWNLPWESHFEPIVIDKLCTVKADYHTGIPRTRFNIRIKPNMAFGTGHHQTTTMMIRALIRLSGGNAFYRDNMLDGRQVLDMGTGTGVLAILAAKIGAKRPVHAIDVDITAINSAKENLWLNRMHKAVEVLYGDASLIQATKYDFILANINRNILLQDMDTYYRGLKPGGFLVMSGFYERDIAKLVETGESIGLRCAGYEVYGTADGFVAGRPAMKVTVADRAEGECGEGEWALLLMQYMCNLK